MTDSESLPPGAKYVEHILEHQGPMTQAELIEETELPRSTVRSALDRLEDLDRITTEPNSDDARQMFYHCSE
jgi:DNA-binding MarR family transcriptional regulator